MKKIIVFGATGTTGAYVIDYLLKNLSLAEFEIIAVGRRMTDFFLTRGVKYFSVDNTEKEDFKKLPTDNIHTVILLSGLLPAYMKGYNPVKYFEINTIGGLNVLQYCVNVNADRIIYAQSFSDLAGYFGKEKILMEDFPRKLNYNNDHTIYLISKCAVVDLLENYRLSYGLKTFVLRLPNIYMHNHNDIFYVNGEKRRVAYREIIDKAIKGVEIEIWGDPTIEKDIVYVKDFCQMVLKTILIDKETGLYNVGTGIGISLEDQIKGIIDVFSPQEKKSVIKYSPEKPSSPCYIMDITNAKKDLGYEPKYNYIEYLIDFKKEMLLDQYKDLDKAFYCAENIK